MDKSFGKELFASPCKKSDSPEDLICYFTRSNCFMVDYSQYDPATDSNKIDTSLFILPFDNFLHSIKEFRPLRSHFLYDGPHVYVRQMMDFFALDAQDEAIRRAATAELMLSKTEAMMGSIEDFLRFSKNDSVARCVAARLVITHRHFWGADLGRGC